MTAPNQTIANTIAQKSGSSFYYSFLFLEKEKQDAIKTVYSFCRISDDIVDSDKPISEKERELDLWRDKFNASYKGKTGHPVLDQLQTVISRFSIPKQYFLDIIDGMAMDLGKTSYARFEDLLGYTYRAASVVGLISIEIFGYENPRAKDYAAQLGNALQLTNILRDAHEDAQIDRYYIPDEDFETAAYSKAELKSGVRNEAFFALMTAQASRAREYYRKAAQLLPAEDEASLKVAEMMHGIYFRTLEAIERSNFNIMNNRVRLSKFQKITTALGVFFKRRFYV